MQQANINIEEPIAPTATPPATPTVDTQVPQSESLPSDNSNCSKLTFSLHTLQSKEKVVLPKKISFNGLFQETR